MNILGSFPPKSCDYNIKSLYTNCVSFPYLKCHAESLSLDEFVNFYCMFDLEEATQIYQRYRVETRTMDLITSMTLLQAREFKNNPDKIPKDTLVEEVFKFSCEKIYGTFFKCCAEYAPDCVELDYFKEKYKSILINCGVGLETDIASQCKEYFFDADIIIPHGVLVNDNLIHWIKFNPFIFYNYYIPPNQKLGGMIVHHTVIGYEIPKTTHVIFAGPEIARAPFPKMERIYGRLPTPTDELVEQSRQHVRNCLEFFDFEENSQQLHFYAKPYDKKCHCQNIELLQKDYIEITPELVSKIKEQLKCNLSEEIIRFMITPNLETQDLVSIAKMSNSKIHLAWNCCQELTEPVNVPYNLEYINNYFSLLCTMVGMFGMNRISKQIDVDPVGLFKSLMIFKHSEYILSKLDTVTMTNQEMEWYTQSDQFQELGHLFTNIISEKVSLITIKDFAKSCYFNRPEYILCRPSVLIPEGVKANGCNYFWIIYHRKYNKDQICNLVKCLRIMGPGIVMYEKGYLHAQRKELLCVLKRELQEFIKSDLLIVNGIPNNFPLLNKKCPSNCR